ncbi:hypothetical protein [Nesterenkonia pannonica]|uniref:hypothetical protein n=1 Tax=Nesterenkonia pannonica TaxID=1548602 RepID=UPI0021648458|nr:hypothetical protein [Nesterenkonia pannonica]
MSFWNTRGRTLTAAAALSVLLVTSCDLMPGGEQESAGDEQNGAGTEPQGDGGAETGGQDDDGSEDSAEGTGADADSGDDAFASAELSDVAGNSVGEVRFSDADDACVMVDIELWDINPGFRAVTLHEEGVCEPQSSNEAGEVGDYFSSGDVLPGTGSGEAGVVEGEDELETEDPDAETDGEEQEEGLGEAEDGAEADGVSTSLEGYPEGSVEGHTAAQVTDPGR